MRSLCVIENAFKVSVSLSVLICAYIAVAQDSLFNALELHDISHEGKLRIFSIVTLAELELGKV